MALADILDAIHAEADAEVEAIVERSEEECDVLIVHARQQAENEKRRLAGSRDATAERQADRIVNRARLEADRALRGEVEDLYLHTRDAAADLLDSLRGKRCYEEVLERLIRECCDALPDALTLHVDPADEGLAHRIVAAGERPDLKVETDLRTSGGAWVSGDNGRIVRNDFESRLARADNLLRLTFAERVVRKLQP